MSGYEVHITEGKSHAALLEVGDDADSWEVHARDAENAAEVALATHNDEGQYVERETLVFVRRLDTGEQRWIRVYGVSIGEGIYVGEQQPEGLEAKAPTSDGSDDEDEGDEEADDDAQQGGADV